MGIRDLFTKKKDNSISNNNNKNNKQTLEDRIKSGQTTYDDEMDMLARMFIEGCMQQLMGRKLSDNIIIKNNARADRRNKEAKRAIQANAGMSGLDKLSIEVDSFTNSLERAEKQIKITNRLGVRGAFDAFLFAEGLEKICNNREDVDYEKLLERCLKKENISRCIDELTIHERSFGMNDKTFKVPYSAPSSEMLTGFMAVMIEAYGNCIGRKPVFDESGCILDKNGQSIERDNTKFCTSPDAELIEKAMANGADSVCENIRQKKYAPEEILSLVTKWIIEDTEEFYSLTKESEYFRQEGDALQMKIANAKRFNCFMTKYEISELKKNYGYTEDGIINSCVKNGANENQVKTLMMFINLDSNGSDYFDVDGNLYLNGQIWNG